MTRSSKYYRDPTRVRRPNHLPAIFNTARLRSASARVRRLALTVLRVYIYSLLLLLAARSCVQVIGHTAEAVKTLATDLNQSNLSLASDQSPGECPLTEVIDDCLSCLFGKWAWHGPGDSDVDCPQVAVSVSDGHLNTCLIGVPLRDTLQNQTCPVGPEGTGGQCQLPFPVASYSTAFKTMFHWITFRIDFILWHTTLVTFNTFVHISLILYEFGPPLWTMNRETWRKLRKASSLSGKRGLSRCRKTRAFLHVYLYALSTHCLCMAVLKRFKHQAVSKRICRQLVRLPSLGLGRGVRCGQRIHGRLVTSFTVQKSFVKHISVRPHRSRPMFLRQVAGLTESFAKAVSFIRLPALPNPAACRLSTFCHAFLRRAACWLSEAVVKPYVFLRGLLLLAGDVERNPGPIQAGMSDCYKDALLCFKSTLKENVDLKTGLEDKLPIAAGGFMSRTEAQYVAQLPGNLDQMGAVVDCLCKKRDEDFFTFLKMLKDTNNGHWADALLAKAEELKRMTVKVEGGGGIGGEGQVESFFGLLRNFYTKMKVVEDEWLPADQSLQYVNLALAPFKLGHRRAHEMFVNAVKEGVDIVYTSRSVKIECEEIPKLVKKHKLVVVSGAPGVGKSTIARKVCQDICQAPDCRGYILVLLVELRDLLLFKKDLQLVDILQLFQGEMGDVITPVELSKVISSNKGKDILFILDGFDELPPHLRQSDFLVKLLSHNLDSPLRGCDVVLTSRSILTSEIYHHMRKSRAQVGLTNIEVLGFTQDQIKEYAGLYFKGQGQPDLLESFISKIDAIPQVRGLCSIPVVLSIICQVFSFKQDLPPTLTEIYNEYMCIKVLKYHDDLATLDSILDLPRDHDIYKLGKIAFDCIQSQKVVFQSSDLKGLGERFSDRIKGCGLLTARPVLADPKLKKATVESYYFIHLTVQEFIAAVYVSLLPAEEQGEIWSKCLGEPHMAQVWRFYCGLTRLTHYELLHANITGYPEDFQMQCLFESQNASLVQKMMLQIVGEEVTVRPMTAYDSTAYGYCLSKHPALKKLTIQTQGGAGSAEIHRLLEPVYASGTLQTLCLGSDVDWRQVEDLFDRIRNCDGALKGHIGKVHLISPPLSVAVKLLYLQHIREVVCVKIKGCKAMDHEVLKEMEKALEVNKTLQKLTLEDYNEMLTLIDRDNIHLPKEFCHHLMKGIGLNTSLSEVCLDFKPFNWDCTIDVPADIHGSVQHVTLKGVPVDVLPRVFLWISQVKHFECRYIHSPQEDEVGERDVKFTEVEKTLSGMDRLEKLVLGVWNRWSKSLMVEFGVSVLKGISGNKHTSHFVLYGRGKGDRVFHSIIDRLPTDVQRQFIIDKYTDKHGNTHPCISRSASACGGTSQDDIDEGGIIGDGGTGNKCDVIDGDDTSAEGQEDDGDHTPSPSQSIVGLEQEVNPTPQSGPPPHLQDTHACGGTSQDGTDEGGIVGDGGAGSKRDVNDGDDTDDRVYTSAEGQEDDDVHTPSPLQSIVGLEQEVDPTPQSGPPIRLQDTLACSGTSQDGTDEGGIVGDGGVASRRDVTDGDDTDDRAYTSAEGQEDDSDHTPSPSQSSDRCCCSRCTVL